MISLQQNVASSLLLSAVLQWLVVHVLFIVSSRIQYSISIQVVCHILTVAHSIITDRYQEWSLLCIYCCISVILWPICNYVSSLLHMLDAELTQLIDEVQTEHKKRYV